MRSNIIPPRKKNRAGEEYLDVELSISSEADGGEFAALSVKLQSFQ